MNKILKFIRHNQGIMISTILMPIILIYAYSCQSVVISVISPGKKITRPELVAEVDFFLSQAEAKFADLDRQDLVKQTIFNSVLDLAKGGVPNPAGVATILFSILGSGAMIDNIRKRTHIKTLKGGNVNVKTQKEDSPKAKT